MPVLTLATGVPAKARDKLRAAERHELRPRRRTDAEGIP